MGVVLDIGHFMLKIGGVMIVNDGQAADRLARFGQIFKLGFDEGLAHQVAESLGASLIALNAGQLVKARQ